MNTREIKSTIADKKIRKHAVHETEARENEVFLSLSSCSFSSVHLLLSPSISPSPCCFHRPRNRSLRGSISWHEYSLPAESLVGERRRLRLRRRQRRRGEGWKNEKSRVGEEAERREEEEKDAEERSAERRHGGAGAHRKRGKMDSDFFFFLRNKFFNQSRTL